MCISSPQSIQAMAALRRIASSSLPLRSRAFASFSSLSASEGPQDQVFNQVSSHGGCCTNSCCTTQSSYRSGQFKISSVTSPVLKSHPIAIFSRAASNSDVDRGQRAAEEALALDPQHGRAYVALSNIYAAAGRWDDVAKIRKLMKDRGVKKEPGKSCIEVNGKMHEFRAGDRSHKQTTEIYAELRRMREEFEEWGYEADLKLVLHDVEDEQKVHLLWRHSEKLAMAFGHLNTPDGTTLRVIKNLRVCPDCHLVSKYISKLYGRDIIMRDANRFHHFHDGSCSCNDYW